jgi:hypothetical protein
LFKEFNDALDSCPALLYNAIDKDCEGGNDDDDWRICQSVPGGAQSFPAAIRITLRRIEWLHINAGDRREHFKWSAYCPISRTTQKTQETSRFPGFSFVLWRFRRYAVLYFRNMM